MSNILEKAVKLVGSGIGAAREGYLTNQENKQKAKTTEALSRTTSEAGPSTVEHSSSATSPDGQPPAYPEDDADEDEWRLDEAAEEIDPPGYEDSETNANTEHDDKDLVKAVLAVAPPISARHGLLPLPVVLPQRRPRAKGRCFVRAYAPILEDSGIDERCFLMFLKNFHAASKVSLTPPTLEISLSKA